MEGFPNCGWEGDPGAMGATTGSRHYCCLQFESFLHRAAVSCVVWPGGRASPGCVRQRNVLQIRSFPALALQSRTACLYIPNDFSHQLSPLSFHICAAMVTESLKGFKSPSEQWRISGVILLRDEQ